MSDTTTFLRSMLATPGRVGAIAPSSPALATCMVDASAIRPGDVVVELGAGTGPVTAELAARLGDQNPLLVLEPDPALAARCRHNVPGVEVVEAYAQDLRALLEARGHDHADRIVSSLPFAGWSADLQDAVFDAILDVLAPGGRMVTFTYVHSPWLPAGRREKALLAKRFARVSRTPVVWANLPPAFVYVMDVDG
ncbi:MAG: methyltransferase domain-containing protein [Alphaproteobacteria bacterium]|nr:methyltransferase domain-containing protein [Alphaproteobacteria bacterium]